MKVFDEQYIKGLIHAVGEDYKVGCFNCHTLFKKNFGICPICANIEMTDLKELMEEVLK